MPSDVKNCSLSMIRSIYSLCQGKREHKLKHAPTGNSLLAVDLYQNHVNETGPPHSIIGMINPMFATIKVSKHITPAPDKRKQSFTNTVIILDKDLPENSSTKRANSSPTYFN